MSDEIKNFFSTSFSIVAVLFMGYGLYKIPQVGLNMTKYYFITGGVFCIISMIIEFTRAQTYDGDDF